MFNKKKLLSLAIASLAGLFIASTASATIAGAYVGGQLGWGQTNIFKGVNTQGYKTNDTGIAGRLFGGYQINQNFAAELGYMKFSNATVKHESGDIQTYAVDIAAKAMMPLSNSFGVYGKLGAAYLNESFGISNGNSRVSFSEGKVYPELGVGVSYDFTQQLSTDLSYTRIQKTSNGNLNSTDFVGLGLSYHFS
ncbi:MAG: outer membrane beta-barrel protein [Gammaproteobacteria bacterium]|nr:outer membrane beta-barrel protein [Gammaproteobacteria bacterium]